MMCYCLFKLLDDHDDAAAAIPWPSFPPGGATRSAGVRSPHLEQATAPPPQQQQHDDPIAAHHDDISHDLQAITDPVLELDALDGMTQIHHGIYKIQAMLLNGGKLQFAFKTECRRASKWHGQQGWSEVAVYHFTRLFYEQRDTPQFATAPAARGVFVSISQAQLDTVVHRDHCGVVSEELLAHVPASAKARKRLQQRLSGGADGGPKRYLLVGVALTWQPSHNDNALPGNDIHTYFSPPPAGGVGSPSLSKRVREIVSQISDVQAMDYLLINDDREEKNWFKDHTGRFVMMDNGWAFAGRGYEGSICGVDAELLTCPPLFRHVMGGAKKCAAGPIANCRYRAETVQTLFEAIGLADGIQSFGQFAQPSYKPALVAQAFASKALADWQHAVLQDPLLQFLDAAYGPQEITNKHKPFSVALERYVQGCAAMPADLTGTASSTAVAAGGGSNGSLVRWMRYGLAVRMVALAGHVATCAAAHGEAYVFGAPLTPRPAEPSASS